MSVHPAAVRHLAALSKSRVFRNTCLSNYTRFAMGGPAAVFFEAEDEAAFLDALRLVRDLEAPHAVIGGGTNLVVSDRGFDGFVLRYTGSAIRQEQHLIRAEAGALLQDVVDRSIALGLKGLETMTGIPGYLGGAIYGNAGAYGHSIQELVRQVRVFDGAEVVAMRNEDCRFAYRGSIFKDHKDWVILSADLQFSHDDPEKLSETAAGIRAIRDAKYPPSMKCAGSIFKNLLLMNLPRRVVDAIPPAVIREGKAPSAWFLEQAGAKGMRRGDVQVAEYHANLVYNDGAGSATDLVAIIEELKGRVEDRFGLTLEEEVQFIGFNGATP